MIYQLYQAQADLLQSLRRIARFGAGMAKLMEAGAAASPLLHHLRASWTLFAEAGLTHHRPSFRIDEVDLGNRFVGVTEEAADDTPFGTLLHFRKDAPVVQPRVLLVAPMSGHFATLLRNTVEVMLPEHDMFITDWKNARDIPLSDGCFGLDDFIGHIIRFLEAIGPGAPYRRGVPAGGGGARRGGADGRGRQSRTAAQHDPDGRADRHQGQSDQGERACRIAADLVVRKEPDRHGALGISRRASPGLSGLPAARRVHQHESRPPCHRAPGAVPQPGRRRRQRAPRRIGSSTTNTAR